MSNKVGGKGFEAFDQSVLKQIQQVIVFTFISVITAVPISFLKELLPRYR